MAQWFKFALFSQRTFVQFPELMLYSSHCLQLELQGNPKLLSSGGAYTHMHTYTLNNK